MKQKLKPFPLKQVLRLLIITVGLISCSDPLPTTNAVRPIELSALDKMVSKADFSGLVVAMASWCAPCRKELPLLGELYREYQDKGIRIMAISLDADGPAAVQPLINELKIPFPVFWVGTAAVKHYKLLGVPTLLVFHHGRMQEKIPGSQSRQFIEQKIKNLLLS